MAESFTGFLGKVTTTTAQDFIPKAGDTCYVNGSSATMGSNTRDSNSTLLVSSINITGIATKTANINNPDWYVRASVYISYLVSNNEQKIYLYDHITLLSGSSFYLEKNITLLPTQKLCVRIDSMSDASDYEVELVASAVSIS